MDLSIKEKRIIFQTLILIMKADFVDRLEETNFLDEVFYDFGLTLEEFDHIDDIDFDYLKKEFAQFTDEQKEFAKQLFVKMAKCDGYVDPREVSLIKEMFEIK